MILKFINNFKRKIPDNHWIRILYSKLKSYFAYFIYFHILQNIKYSNIKVIGITGTDGKTTTSIFSAQLLSLLGRKVGLISSQELWDGEIKQKNYTKRTTPSPFFLYNFLRRCLYNGCDFIIIEVSAHAITQSRIFGIKFDSVAMTNIAQEHGDYYSTIKKYGETKLKLFNMLKNKGLGIINYKTIDKYDFIKKYFDINNKRIQKKEFFISDINLTGFSSFIKGKDILNIQIQKILSNKSVFEIQYGAYKKSVDFFVPGKYNIENIAISILFALYFGFSFQDVITQLSKIKSVSGRLQKININKKYKFSVFVDFAVTPQAIQSVLEYGKSIAKGKVWIVFGATGGNHDHKKRPLMGQVVNKFADKVILTEDESYGENVFKIWDDILKGVSKNNFNSLRNRQKTPKKDFFKYNNKIICISSRFDAIKYAIENIGEGDVLIITGMGDLESRNNGEKEVSWSDINIVKDLLK